MDRQPPKIQDPPPAKLSRTEEARRLIEEYVASLQQVIQKLRRKMN
ncbi:MULTISPECIES: hypothetical protein [Bradyrhizobium]|nr:MULTISPECIES: hypothetical protein [Bradyrhizobium]UFW47205.1 hypothetical protein BaraCB756_33780 [Bradyrhizobium arachidis]